MKKLTLLCTALLALAVTAPAAEMNIVETAKSTGTFKTLVAALDAGGKTEMLEEKGPYTVFAPTDEAFNKLPKGTVEGLLKPENKEKLAALLAYHVMKGEVMAKDVKTMMAPTSNGADLDIKVKGDTVMVNDAKVVKADVKASNGVIHVIDKVLMPPTKKS
ncbi:MAG: fasciclin domain-containing protein [Chthoniobacterales bacterium]